ncbi:hypothetical protein ACS5PN_30520 [Roseateles sp. NT4]
MRRIVGQRAAGSAAIAATRLTAPAVLSVGVEFDATKAATSLRAVA